MCGWHDCFRNVDAKGLKTDLQETPVRTCRKATSDMPLTGELLGILTVLGVTGTRGT